MRLQCTSLRKNCKSFRGILKDTGPRANPLGTPNIKPPKELETLLVLYIVLDLINSYRLLLKLVCGIHKHRSGFITLATSQRELCVIKVNSSDLDIRGLRCCRGPRSASEACGFSDF